MDLSPELKLSLSTSMEHLQVPDFAMSLSQIDYRETNIYIVAAESITRRLMRKKKEIKHIF